MKYPLTSLLYLIILIAKEVLLVGTGELTEVPIATIETTPKAILSRLQGTFHLSTAVIKNQHVITVQVYTV